MTGLASGLACATLLSALPALAAAQTNIAPHTMVPMPAGVPALNVRSLRATRTRSGYRLSGQAQVRDACSAARFRPFLGVVFPPSFDAVQYRRPAAMGALCAPRPTWVRMMPISVTSAAPPRWVSVNAAHGTVPVAVR